MLGNATEPVWMMVWGVALLFLASGARSLMARRPEEPIVTAHRAKARTSEMTPARANIDLMMQTRG